MKLRVGRKLGRTIYIQPLQESTDSDPVIGMMDSRELAEMIVSTFNSAEAMRSVLRRLRPLVASAGSESDLMALDGALLVDVILTGPEDEAG
jgi:hypothetical protein